MKFFLVCLLLVQNAMAAPKEGNSVGNGGDAVALEFILSARSVVDLAKQSAVDLGFSADHLAEAVNSTKVISEKTLVLAGNEVSAINYPAKKLIKVSSSRWRAVQETRLTTVRLTLVLHEYLGIMGLDDLNYRISQPAIKAMGAVDLIPRKWWDPMNPTNFFELYMVGPGGKNCMSIARNQNFNLKVREENLYNEIECGGAKRIITVAKTAQDTKRYLADGFEMQGVLYSFLVEVFDGRKRLLGRFTYTPQPGNCLVDVNMFCQQSGLIQIEGVFISFSYYNSWVENPQNKPVNERK